jgi:predicted metal-dependent TIM-barrel fold hydrolase
MGFQTAHRAARKRLLKKYTAITIRPTARQKSASRIVTKDKTQQQIDEILDKISKSGYDSLTASEKEFLLKQENNQ